MNQRLNNFAKKTYEVFCTRRRLGQPQVTECAKTVQLEFPNSNPTPYSRNRTVKATSFPATHNVSGHDPGMALPQSDSHPKSLAPIITPSTPPIENVDLPGSSDAEMKIFQEAPQLTTGPSRIIVSHDGLAMLLTKDMIAELSRIIKSSRQLEFLEEQYNKAKRNVSSTQTFIEKLELLMASSEDEDEKVRVKEGLEKRKATYLRDVGRRDQLDHEVRFSRLDLHYMQDLLQGTFEKILSDANLIDMPELVHEDGHASSRPQSPEPGLLAPSETDEKPMTTNLSEGRMVLEEVERTRQNLFQAQELFDATRDVNEKDKIEYQRMKAIGMVDFSEHELDLVHFQNLSENARALIIAEQEHKEAQAKARELRLLGNEWDQESDFVDDPDDGYRESQEADMKAAPSVEYMRNWTEETTGCQNAFSVQPEEKEVDYWEAKSVAMCDTLSCVDLDLNHRRRIDQWQETMESQREECKLQNKQISLKRRDSLPPLESYKRLKRGGSDQSAFARRLSCSNFKWRLPNGGDR